MKKTSMIVAAAMCLGLSACEPTSEDNARVKRMLPPGCEIMNLGQWGNISQLVVVNCAGHSARATHWRQSAGKTSSEIVSIEIE